MKNRKNLFLLFFFAGCLGYAQEKNADSLNCCGTKSCSACLRPDAFAPAGVTTDHVHHQGEWSIAYAFMFADAHGNRSGTRSVSDDEIYYSKGYMMAPRNMNMQMHMLMPMYGVTNRITLMGMIHYLVNTMSMRMMPSQNSMSMPGMGDYSKIEHSSASAGFGDTKLYLLYNLSNNCAHRLVAGAGVSLPTGSIAYHAPTMLSNDVTLPYNMQLGTGTYDLLPSLVYVGQSSCLTFGAALSGNIKTGANSRGYKWGNEYSGSSWLACKVHSWTSISLRGEYFAQGKISGYDAETNQSSGNDPSANVNNYGAQQRISAFAGINVTAPAGCLKGARLFFEYGLPLFQKQEGLQMSFKSSLLARLQYNF